MAARLPRKGGKFMQMETDCPDLCDHRSVVDGAKVMTATSGPGFR